MGRRGRQARFGDRRHDLGTYMRGEVGGGLLVSVHTGLKIDLGAFSRRHPPNTGSSGTVMG